MNCPGLLRHTPAVSIHVEQRKKELLNGMQSKWYKEAIDYTQSDFPFENSEIMFISRAKRLYNF